MNFAAGELWTSDLRASCSGYAQHSYEKFISAIQPPAHIPKCVCSPLLLIEDSRVRRVPITNLALIPSAVPDMKLLQVFSPPIAPFLLPDV